MQNENVITKVDTQSELPSRSWSPNNDDTFRPVISYVSIKIATLSLSTPLAIWNFLWVVNKYEIIYLITL